MDKVTVTPLFQPVPMPVDVSDKERFPNIAEAIEHARKLRQEKNDERE